MLNRTGGLHHVNERARPAHLAESAGSGHVRVCERRPNRRGAAKMAVQLASRATWLQVDSLA